MSAPHLFTTFQLGPLTLNNRIVVSPMCQYSASDGSANDWHLQHLMQMALTGAGLVMIEATHVERHGRITHGCLGLYSNENEATLARVLTAARQVAPKGTKFGIQLAHAGRKASVQRPWEGGKPLDANDDPWLTLAPSAIPFAPGWHTPKALNEVEITRIIGSFVKAAERAVRIGFDVVELHDAHGYLVHEFISPLSNHRTDGWGGSPENRDRLALMLAEAVGKVLPSNVALGARITGTDWADGGLTVQDAVRLAKGLKQCGAVYTCVSGGFVVPPIAIPFGPGFQAHLAADVRREANIATRAVGGIDTPELAERIVGEGQADMVALARAFLADPRWVWRAAETLGADIPYPPQYARAKGLRKPA